MKHLTLKTKVLFLLFLGNLLGSFLFALTTLYFHWDGAMRSLDFRLLRAAYTAAYFIGEAYHQQLLTDDPTGLEPPAATRQRLIDVAEKMGVRHVFSLVMENGALFYSASSAWKENHLPQPPTFHREFPVLHASPELLQVFLKKQIAYQENQSDEGRFRTAFLPLSTPGGRAFLIGADVPVESIRDRIIELWQRYLLMGLIFFLIPFGLVFFLLHRTSRHLQRLSGFTRVLIESHFSPDPTAIAGIREIAREHADEIGQISASLAAMHEALQIHINHLAQITAERERIAGEIRIARDIQRSILPQRFPPHHGSDHLELFALVQPAGEVGGDFFDFTTLPDNRLLITAGDVSGKGVPASLFMAVTVTLLKTYGKQTATPEEILRKTNLHLCRDNDLAMFATVFCGILDPLTGELPYAVAGHNSPILIKADAVEFLPAGGIALGITETPEFMTGTTRLDPTTLLLLYTDGVTEAMNLNNQLFTEKRLLQSTTIAPRRSPYELVANILHQVEEFSHGMPQADDIMLMAIRPRNPAAGTGSQTTLTIRNSLSEYPRVNQFMEEYWAQHFLPSTLFPDFMVVLEEVTSNIIRYAFPQPGEHEILFSLEILGNSIMLEIRDSGRPFNPLHHVRSSGLPASTEDRVGGLGIFLVKKLVSEIHYVNQTGQNILRLRLNIPSQTQPKPVMLKDTAMKITETTQNNRAVLTISGRIDTQTSIELEGALSDAADRGLLHLILDLTALDYITSGGLRVLLQHARKVQPQGGKLILAGLQPEVWKVFQITGFLTIFSCFPTAQEALNGSS
jgi:sigma-B regulation protein RsbU (phosphoserine phosphatase)